MKVIPLEAFREEVESALAESTPSVRRVGLVRALADAWVWPSSVWRGLRLETDERLERYRRSEDV